MKEVAFKLFLLVIFGAAVILSPLYSALQKKKELDARGISGFEEVLAIAISAGIALIVGYVFFFELLLPVLDARGIPASSYFSEAIRGNF
jgi:uncharacterized membrane protein